MELTQTISSYFIVFFVARVQTPLDSTYVCYNTET